MRFFITTTIMLGWIPSAVLAHNHHHHERHLITDFACETPDATAKDLRARDRALAMYSARLSENNEIDMNIPVCFHVVTQTDGGGEVTDSQLQEALDFLNLSYSSGSCCDTSLDWCNNTTDCSVDTGFSFSMAALDENGNYDADGETVSDVSNVAACVTRTVNDAWSTSDRDGHESMKTALRKGDRKVLNIYWVNWIIGSRPDKSVLGYATLPFFEYSLFVDGVVMNHLVAPRGGAIGLDEGDILTHEVGHWLGLSHTFQGGCDGSDGIPDTPPQLTPNSNSCVNPLSIDTCPGGGTDPVFNYMDYSDNSCSFEFTFDQRNVMAACWDIYRLGNAGRPDLELEIGVPSAPMDLAPGERQVFTVPNVNGVLTCVTTTVDNNPEGDLDLFLKMNRRIRYNTFTDICSSTGPTNFERCQSRRSGFLSWIFNLLFGGSATGTLYVGVVAEGGLAVKGMQVTCSYA